MSVLFVGLAILALARTLLNREPNEEGAVTALVEEWLPVLAKAEKARGG